MSPPDALRRSWRSRSLRLPAVLFVVILLVAFWSIRTERQTIADFHGAGPLVRMLGLIVGLAAGLATWKVAQVRLTSAAAVVVAVATASVFAALPGQLDQTAHLLRHYAEMSERRAETAGGYQIPSTEGRPEPFEAIRRAIPEGDTYVLYADSAFALWARYRLLPRLAVTSLSEADWAVLHRHDWHKHANRLLHVRRIEEGTWVARVAR